MDYHHLLHGPLEISCPRGVDAFVGLLCALEDGTQVGDGRLNIGLFI